MFTSNETSERSTGDARVADKAITEALVRDQLAELAPDEFHDLPVVFDTVYMSAERRLDGAIERSEPGEDGLPFDASFVLGTVLSSAVWIVCSLIRVHRLQASTAQRAELVRQLGEQVGSTARVRELEEQVGRLLTSVDQLSDALEARERSLHGNQRDLIVGPSCSSLSSEPSLPPLTEAGSSPLESGPELLLLVVEQGPVAGRFHLLGYRLLGHGSDGEPIHLRCPPHILRRAPAPYIAEILANGGAGPPSVRVGKLGTFLGERLVPPELMKRFQELGHGTLQVLPEVPAIPWEILRLSPKPDGGEASSPFFADVFALSQWPGAGSPALHLGASKIALVAPQDSGLPAGKAEADHVEALAELGRKVVRVPARYETVSEALTTGDFDVFHFTGHGVAPGGNPDRWTLVLDGGTPFSPVDLATGIGNAAARPPLVFLNACHSARQGWSLIGIGGLAAAFVEAGAGAVVGANWAVADAAARTFAEGFYRHFLAGTPIAEAARQARRLLRQQDRSDSTRLAYTVLADPRARCFEAKRP